MGRALAIVAAILSVVVVRPQRVAEAGHNIAFPTWYCCVGEPGNPIDVHAGPDPTSDSGIWTALANSAESTSSTSWTANTYQNFDYRGRASNAHPVGNNANTAIYSSVSNPAWIAEAQLTYCEGAYGTICRAHIHFKGSGVNWYKGTGSPGPTQHDLWSVAMHELGHFISLQDLIDGTEPNCNSATMCGSIPGTTYHRTPDGEDINSANASCDMPVCS